MSLRKKVLQKNPMKAEYIMRLHGTGDRYIAAANEKQCLKKGVGPVLLPAWATYFGSKQANGLS